MKSTELDEIDFKILEVLQKQGRKTIKEIASEVCLSSPAVSSRIEKLEKANVITGYQAQVNPIVLGLYTKAFISLEVAPVQKKKFYPFIQGRPEVVECNCVTGDYSMLLEVYFHTTVELDTFINELQKFGRTKTLIVFSTSVEHRGLKIN